MAKRRVFLPGRTTSTPTGGPITLRVVEVAADHSVVEMGIDYTKADVPDRAYYADYCDVQRGRVGMSLVFGKLEPGSPRLRTKIEVVFPEQMFLDQLWASSREFHETVRKATEPKRLSPLAGLQDTDKVQTFRANNVLMGMWGEDSVQDFYYISPRDMHFLRVGARAEVALEPVVRVVMATALMLDFLDKCRPHVEALTRANAVQQGTT